MAAAGERVAVVLGGGGARGAYEAGALSVLLPELERRGQRPALFVGTSAGALNTALLAATAHLPAAEVAELATAIWSELRYGQVLEPLVSPGSIGRVHDADGDVAPQLGEVDPLGQRDGQRRGVQDGPQVRARDTEGLAEVAEHAADRAW